MKYMKRNKRSNRRKRKGNMELAQQLETARKQIVELLQEKANAASELQRREYIEQQVSNMKSEFSTLLETKIATLKQEIQTLLNRNRELHREEYSEISQQLGGSRAELNNFVRTESSAMRQEIQAMLTQNRDAHRQEYAELAQQLENARAEVNNLLRTDNASLTQQMRTTLERSSQAQRQECTELARQQEATQLTLSRNILETTNTIATLRARVVNNQARIRSLEERITSIERNGKSFIFKEHTGDIVVCNTYKAPEKKKSRCCIS